MTAFGLSDEPLTKLNGPRSAGPDLVVQSNELPIVADVIAAAPHIDCWNKIGVKGDQSCPELLKYVHCRNCPVFSTAGQRLFEREPPAGHLAEWTKRLADPEIEASRGTLPVVIFRVSEEWLAIDIRLLVEIAEPRPIHSVPHRTNQVLAGLVNIRGELELCVSLRGLLGLEVAQSDSEAEITPPGPPLGRGGKAAHENHAAEAILDVRTVARLMVVSRNGKRWVFQVDEVQGVQRFSESDVTNVPSTVSGSLASYSRGVFWLNDRRIGYLDESRLFDTLERSLI